MKNLLFLLERHETLLRSSAKWQHLFISTPFLPQCCSSTCFQLLLVWGFFSAGGGGADLIRCGSSGNTSWFVILWRLFFLYTLQYSCKIIKPSGSCNQFTRSFALKLKRHHHGHSNQVLLQIPRAESIPSQGGFFQGLDDSRNYSWCSSRFSLTTVQCCHPTGLPFMYAENRYFHGDTCP